MAIDFLDREIILMLHRKSIEKFGGADGIRDSELLESAIAQAEQSFGDNYLHAFPWEMAAAYLFHICQDHPFTDGNKRTALAAAQTFLGLNGRHLYSQDMRLEELTMAVAKSEIDKSGISKLIEEIYTQTRNDQ